MIGWDTVTTPLGDLYIAVSEKGVRRVDYDVTMERFLQAASSLPHVDLSHYTRQFTEYFAGERTQFDMPIDLDETPAFRREVLLAAREIPFGQTRTYGEVATMAGHPGAARAAGQAMRGNPIPLIIPCHRVVGATGIGGYGGPEGVAVKRWLLTFEGAEIP